MWQLKRETPMHAVDLQAQKILPYRCEIVQCWTGLMYTHDSKEHTQACGVTKNALILSYVSERKRTQSSSALPVFESRWQSFLPRRDHFDVLLDMHVEHVRLWSISPLYKHFPEFAWHRHFGNRNSSFLICKACKEFSSIVECFTDAPQVHMIICPHPRIILQRQSGRLEQRKIGPYSQEPE